MFKDLTDTQKVMILNTTTFVVTTLTTAVACRIAKSSWPMAALLLMPVYYSIKTKKEDPHDEA